MGKASPWRPSELASREGWGWALGAESRSGSAVPSGLAQGTVHNLMESTFL